MAEIAFRLAVDLVNKGTSLDSLGNPQEALRCYDEAERILKPHKGNDEVVVAEFLITCNRAVAYDNLGNYQISLNQWDRALKLAEHIPFQTRRFSNTPIDRSGPLLGKSLTLARMGKLEKAMKICQEVISKQPNNPVGLSRMGYFCLLTGKYQESIHWSKRALEYDQYDMHSIANLGAAFLGVNRYEEARVALEKALEISPNHPPVLYSMGSLLLFEGSPSEAINYFKKAVTFNPKHTEAWNHLGIALLESGQAGSRECFENALTANAGNLSAAVNLAMIICRETSCSRNEAARQTMEFINHIRGA